MVGRPLQPWSSHARDVTRKEDAMSRPFDPRFPSSHLFVDPCSAVGLSQHPPVAAATKDPNESGVYGIHCANGTGALGASGGGRGLAATSKTGEGRPAAPNPH